MTTRSVAKKMLLALGATLLLTGCDAIEIKPVNYNDPVVVNNQGAKVDVYDNIMGVLYDSISSNKKDDVLQNFMNIIAEETFGKWSEIVELVTADDDAKIKTFIEAHKKAYIHDNKVTKEDGTEVEEDEYLAAQFETTVDAIRKDRLINFFNNVKDQINEVFYNEIISKSYNDDTGKFYEYRLAVAHAREMYDILMDLDGQEWYEGYVTPDLKKDDVSSLIHLDGRYDDYINRHIIRSVYKDKLVEDYLLKNNYSTLGRAYGRKVNYIKLTRDDKFKELPTKLMEAYATTYVDTGKIGDGEGEMSFDSLANCWRGFRGLKADGTVEELSADEKALLAASNATPSSPITIEGVCTNLVYYKETQFGQMMDKYNLIDENNRFASEEAASALSEFTNSFAYTKEKGLKIKLASLALTDYTTDGWFVKNGGLTELPEALRNRLFNINVAKELDDAEYVYESSSYTRKVQGNYFVTPSTSEVGDNHNYINYIDGSFYLVQVEEAVSTSKLSITGKNSYVAAKKGGEALFTEEIARHLAETLGTKDSYINNAYASYIKECSLTYHDTAILDYFKEKYPELFE